jgi:hypothetical protein
LKTSKEVLETSVEIVQSEGMDPADFSSAVGFENPVFMAGATARRTRGSELQGRCQRRVRAVRAAFSTVVRGVCTWTGGRRGWLADRLARVRRAGDGERDGWRVGDASELCVEAGSRRVRQRHWRKEGATSSGGEPGGWHCAIPRRSTVGSRGANRRRDGHRRASCSWLVQDIGNPALSHPACGGARALREGVARRHGCRRNPAKEDRAPRFH